MAWLNDIYYFDFVKEVQKSREEFKISCEYARNLMDMIERYWKLCKERFIGARKDELEITKVIG